jgi:large subunit ribosomal protein L10
MKSKEQFTIPESKKRLVRELEELIKKYPTILVSSIKNIPDSQFQKIKKSLRGKAIVKVPKKSLIFRAIDNSKNKNLVKIKENIDEQIAVLFSDLDSFELAAELIEKKTPAKAKSGQEALDNIIVEEGPTELIPGPAMSELGALGIQIKIEKGKINIKESKVIVKKGDKISNSAAEIMSKLDIKPFEVGFIPIASFDNKKGKLYINIKINKKEFLKNIIEAYSKSISFAINNNYICDKTITFIIAKADLNSKILEEIKNSYILKKNEENNKEGDKKNE